jgi:D-alanyl-D-alanine carboxypeptidase/D-alanyl-D-alanine-endopeptidase (penicillin-binding protein 4)
MLRALLFLLILSPNCFGQNTIEKAIETFVSGQGLEHASISFKVVDLSNNTSIASHNPQTSLATASTTKLFSTATALDILGPDYRAKTRLYIDGEIDSTGSLKGNIWIRGGGDPSLGSKYFTKEGHQLDFMKVWCDTLESLGIKQIEGSVISDASEFGYEGAPDGWNWVDLGNYYGAGPSGLSIYDNLVRYTFNCPAAVGRLTKVRSIEPYVPDLIFHNYVRTSERKGDNAYLFGGPYATDRFGTGTLPAGATSFVVKGSLPDPEFQFAFEFDQALKKHGIKVMSDPKSARRIDMQGSNKSYNSRTLIYTHYGVKLIRIINETNLRSVNLFAEHMINLIGFEKTSSGSTSSGLKVLKNHWSKKFNTQGLNVTDGSGLSRTNGISAEHFIDLLEYMSTSKYKDDFFGSLPVAGTSGTLRNVCRGQSAQKRLVAKSGSMSRIKSYSGYINSSSGKKLAFALIVNNYDCSSSILKRRMEILFNQMSVY